VASARVDSGTLGSEEEEDGGLRERREPRVESKLCSVAFPSVRSPLNTSVAKGLAQILLVRRFSWLRLPLPSMFFRANRGMNRRQRKRRPSRRRRIKHSSCEENTSKASSRRRGGDRGRGESRQQKGKSYARKSLPSCSLTEVWTKLIRLHGVGRGQSGIPLRKRGRSLIQLSYPTSHLWKVQMLVSITPFPSFISPFLPE